MSAAEPSPTPFYLTTPIYYINARPHLGHAYTTLVADAMCRYRRLAGDDVHFLTGTDEHGDKIAQAAAAEGEAPRALADRNAAAFRAQWDALGITYDDFIRTTEPRHAVVVQAVLRRLWDAGEIYFGKYGGQYCFGCERFYTEKEIVDGKCPDHQTPLVYLEEENYFFRMSRYQDWLRTELETHPDRVRPERYRNELLGFLREPLLDLSISRPRTRLEWGIPLPFDDRFVTYVWFDALLNYVSALGGPDAPRFTRYWPCVQHLIGKDILKPHGIYWPCMLRAAGLPLYRHLNVHGYWTLGGGKISKSVGNVVEALQLAETYGRDAFRYFVLREMPFGQDANFSEEALVARLNADLANDLGNLVSRATTMIVNFGHGGDAAPAPSSAEDLAIGLEFARARAGVEEAMEEFAFHRALAAIWSFLGVLNRYIDATQPWALAKRPDRRDRLTAVLVTLTDALRCLGILLDPFLPDAARRIRGTLGLEAPPRLAEAAFGHPGPVPRVEKLSGLFPRVTGVEDSAQPADAVRAAKGQRTEAARAAEGRARAASAAAKPRVTIQEFQRLDLRVGEVLAAEPVARSKKLLKLTVKLGEETRTVVAGVAEHYAPEALRGRKIVIVANLEPATLMGVESNGMVLAGSAGETLALVGLDRDLPPGAVVR
jgi:methionyl-tRNA synthetase